MIGVSTTRLGAEFLQKALRNLIGALILGDLLAHDEDIGVAAHFFGHRIAKRFADADGDHFGSGGKIRIRQSGFPRRSRNGCLCFAAPRLPEAARGRSALAQPAFGFADIVLAVNAKDVRSGY